MNSFNFKSYFNFLSRNRGFTAVNLIGFSTALTFIILLGLYIGRESRADRFHAQGDRVFRLLNGENESYWPDPVAADLRDGYPGIEATMRLYDDYFVVGKEDATERVRATALIVDPTFFTLFSFPMAAGDPARQLLTAGDVTLSERFAMQLFGTPDAVGRPLTVRGKAHIVTGVVRDFPLSHFKTPDIVVNFDGHVGKHYLGKYNYHNFAIYLLAAPGVDLPAQAEEIERFLRAKSDMLDEKVSLERLADSYFNPEMVGGWRYVYRGNSRQFIRVFGLTALLVLLFAIINYANLSVALSGFRAREAATRRLLGGTRAGLFAGYILESVLFCAGAFAIAFFLAEMAEPLFNRAMGSDISVGDALRPAVLALCAGFAIALGIVSGFFPALILTHWKPIDVVKGEFTRKTRMVYSRLFIGLQFSLTIVLIGCAITIQRQTRFLKTTDLGFDKEQLIYLENLTDNDRLPALRERLMTVPGVEMVSFVAGTPYTGSNNNTFNYDDGTKASFQIIEGDSLLFPILGLETVRETGFGADTAGITTWLNETAVRTLGLAPDAREFRFNRPMPFAGVVRDFHIDKLQSPIPMVIVRVHDDVRSEEFDSWEILVKVSAGNPAKSYRQLVAAYLDYTGGEPFDSGFIDAGIASWYDEQERAGTLIGWFSLLAIVISALGLLAMATYFMRQRSRDIAVRKVFGATNSEVLRKLILGFLKIVAVSFVIAVPVIWYIMTQWLQTFAYRIPLSWTIFALAGVLAGAIAFGAVFWQSWRAANTNPVDTLHK